MKKENVLKENNKKQKKLIARKYDFCVAHRGEIVFDSKFLKKANDFYEAI